MTDGAEGGQPSRRRIPEAARRRLRRDLGPSAPDAPREEASGPPFTFDDAADALTHDVVEFASLLAEEAVQPYLAARRDAVFRGWSQVVLTFSDERTLASFRRTGSVRPEKDGAWGVVRTWADADGDGGLDEAMCARVARHLAEEFPGLLTARILTWVQS